MFIHVIAHSLHFIITFNIRTRVCLGKSDIRGQLDSAIEDLQVKHAALETTEKNALRMAMTEERRHFCVLIKCIQPIMVIYVN